MEVPAMCVPAESASSVTTTSGQGSPAVASDTLSDPAAPSKFQPQSSFELIAQILPAAAGSFIEWYEFAVYGYESAYITANFFADGHGGSLGTWAGFAITFAVRPLGGAFFGHLSDRCGRAPAMRLTIAIMLATTILQGCLPTFVVGGEAWGWFGLVVFLLCRVLQGLSAGGELSTAAVYISEISPKDRLGRNLAWLSASGAFASFAVAALVVAWVEGSMTPEAMVRWGWRVPYITSVIPGVAIILCRRFLNESPDFEELMKAQIENSEASCLETGIRAKECANPLRQVFAKHMLPVVLGALGIAGIGAIWYVPTIYGVQVIQRTSALPASAVTMSEVIPWALPSLLAFFAGWLVDVWGACKVHVLALVSCGIVAPLCMFDWWGSVGSDFAVPALFIGQAIFGVLMAVTTATYLWLVELFPVAVRTTGVSLAYNVGIGVFGGLGPLVCDLASSWLPAAGALSPPALYTALASILSLVAVGVSLALARHGKVQLTHIRATPY